MERSKPASPVFCGCLGGRPTAGLGDSTSLSDDDSPRSFGSRETLPFLGSWLPLLTQIPAKEAFSTTPEFPVEGWNQGGQWDGGRPPQPGWAGTVLSGKGQTPQCSEPPRHPGL